MEGKNNLYFDIWRKGNFTELVSVYTDLFHFNEEPQSSNVLRMRLKHTLATYFSGENFEERREISKKEWQSAYTLGLELGVFFKVDNSRPAKYKLSPLGERLKSSQITSAQFLTTYLLNFNQLIANEVVHPLEAVLNFMASNDTDELYRDDIIDIPTFNLRRDGITQQSQRQQANIFLHRLVDSRMFEEVTSRTDKGRKIKLSNRYSETQIRNNINKFDLTPEKILAMDAEGYVHMISTRNNLTN